VVKKCQGGSCITKACRIDKLTGTYEKECEFVPETQQTEKASIMFAQSIDSVSSLLFFHFLPQTVNEFGEVFHLGTSREDQISGKLPALGKSAADSRASSWKHNQG
jgi:hypothetical protein